MSTLDEALSIDGLAAPVRISIDRWGIPHIEAESLPDLFFAQGFNAARDRLWQMDLARKRGLGLLAADFGPGYLAQDRAARLFLYRGDMAAEWACYGPDAEAICTSFTLGINAYIDLLGREPARLPPEFGVTGTTPAKWAPEDVVRVRTHGWMRNALSEVVRANVMAKTDAATDLLRTNLEPARAPHVAEGLDLAAIPLKVLDTYKLAIAPVAFSRERLEAPLEQAGAWTTVTPLGQVVADPTFQGSNNWAVAGARTATGRPILANDPHRAHAVPSLRYLVHLTAPGFDAIGGGEPILPGIMLGHNGHSAFGLTLFFGPDEEDVHAYETKPGNPTSYRYQGDWEEMQVIEETVGVKGAAEQTLRLAFTRHGPVIFEDPASNRAFALCSVWPDPGTTPYGASLISMRARNFDEFRRAMRNWKVPAVSQVYADVTGDIGWITAGASPVRENWDGLLPVPGDGRYEWRGMLDPDDMPWTRNPEKGFVATANEMNVPAEWHLKAEKIGFEWWEPSRAVRIHDVLGGQRQHSVADSQALQTDVTSLPARSLLPLVLGLAPHDADAARAVAFLRGWDCRLAAESGPAALFELWWSAHVKPALMERLVPDAATRALVMAPGDVASILRILEAPDPRLGAGDPARARDELLGATLAAAWRDAAARLGEATSGWEWGKLHRMHFVHATSAVKPPDHPLDFDVGPLAKGGGDSTPMMAAYRAADFRIHMGASVRVVVDVGAWDNSVCINAPGQSGDPRSPHYQDLAPLWAKGEYVPMLYSRDKIAAATTARITLTPASP